MAALMASCKLNARVKFGLLRSGDDAAGKCALQFAFDRRPCGLSTNPSASQSLLAVSSVKSRFPAMNRDNTP
jgi:hypothetical protein